MSQGRFIHETERPMGRCVHGTSMGCFVLGHIIQGRFVRGRIVRVPGSGLFFILKRSSYLNSFKVGIVSTVYKIWSCWFWYCYRSKDFPRVLILPARIRVNKLVIPGGIPFFGWISCPWAGNSRRKTLSYGGFHVYELVITGRITIYPLEGDCWQSVDEKSSGQ
jgi:hypothetical protein